MGETLSPACARDHTEINFRLSKFGFFRGDDHIARHRKFASATECISRNCGNDRFLNRANPIKKFHKRTFDHLHRRHFCHLANICASRKNTLAARNHDCANILICVKCRERRDQFGHQRTVERIHCIGAVQGDQTNSFFFLAKDRFVSHFLPPE